MIKFNKRIITTMILVYFLSGMVSFVLAEETIFTQEEKDFIKNSPVLRVVSIDGIAPLSYTDSKGEINGIGVGVLKEISEATGLTFEYKLYDSITESLESDFDIYLNAASSYASDNMVLSNPYLKSETIVCINSSVDPNNLEDKQYALIRGGTIPPGVDKDKIVYSNNREDALNAVESGKADYCFGNEYSVAFYTLQNGYKNIITIPTSKEEREYCAGLPQRNDILLSILNKAIDGISEHRMQSIILEVASQVERKVTLAMITDAYGREIFGLTFLIIILLLFSIISTINSKNKYKIENKKYRSLSIISNECLFEYSIRENCIKFSDKFCERAGIHGRKDEIVTLLRETLDTLDGQNPENVSTIELPLNTGDMGVFKITYSRLDDINKEPNIIIGKITDISNEIKEKELLISKSRLDGLTGLYNATTTEELIIKRLKVKENNKLDAFILMDCDKFKTINDNFGHLKGNQVLEDISNSLKNTFRQTDILGRIGGDEFCIYMDNIPSIEFARLKCLQLVKHLEKTNKESFQISVSIGIAIPDKSSNYEELFRRADEALYFAKASGGAQIIIYEEDGLTA